MIKFTKSIILPITIVVISLLSVYGIVSCEKEKDIDNSVVDTEEEIIDLFLNNKDMFVESAESLYKFKFDWGLKSKRYIGKIKRDDWKYEYLDNQIELTIRDKNNSYNMPIIKDVVETIKIKDILKDLEFKSVTRLNTMDLNCIYFTKTNFGDIGSGIVYCTENIPQNKYITSLKEIEPGWYYFDSK